MPKAMPAAGVDEDGNEEVDQDEFARCFFAQDPEAQKHLARRDEAGGRRGRQAQGDREAKERTHGGEGVEDTEVQGAARIVETGTHDELVGANGTYTMLGKRQFGEKAAKEKLDQEVDKDAHPRDKIGRASCRERV